jgi:hypothetical protein
MKEKKTPLMVCIKDAYPVGSEPAAHVIYNRYQHRTVRLMRDISALQKYPKIKPASVTPDDKTITKAGYKYADISRKYRVIEKDGRDLKPL